MSGGGPSLTPVAAESPPHTPPAPGRGPLLPPQPPVVDCAGDVAVVVDQDVGVAAGRFDLAEADFEGVGAAAGLGEYGESLYRAY